MQRAGRVALWVGGGTAVFVAVIAVGVLLMFRDSATPVTRAEATFGLGSLESGTGVGDQGLYVYETTGFETASALGGSTHNYPAESFLSIRPDECGTTYRWQSLEERWDEITVCDDGSIDRFTSYHEWFGVEDLSVYVCDETAHFLPVGDETSWSFSCVNEGVTTQNWVFEVVGLEIVDVGGEAVEVLHIVASETLTGDTIGGGVIHRWILPDRLLVVKESVEIANTTDSHTPVGYVDYTEQYDLILTSLTPSE